MALPLPSLNMVLLESKGLLKDVIRNIAICDWCGALPYQWSPSLEKLVAKPPLKLTIYKVHLIISFLYIIGCFAQVGNYWKSASLSVVTHSVMFLTIGVLSLVTHIVNFACLEQVIALFNSFLQFEKETLEQEKKPKTKKPDRWQYIAKYLMLVERLTGVFMPITYHMDVIRNPCFPMYVGYWLSTQCQLDNLGKALKPSWAVEEIVANVAITMTSYYVWCFLLIGYCLHLSLQLVLHGHCFRTYIRDWGSEITKVSRIESVSAKMLSTYRQLQILCIEYRICFSNAMLGVSTTGICVIATICMYNTIQTVSGRNTTGSLQYDILYAWSGNTCLLIVVCVNGILADVYKVSLAVMDTLGSHSGLNKSKWFKKWFKSCPVLKIYLGGSNFFDQLTPLTLLDFVIDQTVSLLLVKN